MQRLSRCRQNRRGQVLLEFAVIALVFAIMIGGMLSLGHMFFVANSLQPAVDVAAQEIARTPLPAAMNLGLGSFDDSLGTVMDLASFRQQIYDEKYLVIHPSELGSQSLTDFAKSLPLLNRLLVTSMIYDPSYASGVYRYPGAIVTYTDPDGADEETVVIPLLGTDQTVAAWVKPVEEMTTDGVGPFSVIASDPSSSSFQPGMVALRINYPFQAAGLVKYIPSTSDPGMVERVTADDTTTQNAAIPGSKYTLAVAANSDTFDGTSRVNSGQFGLGRTASYSQSAGSLGVRPYRRVVTSQAIYRREVFE